MNTDTNGQTMTLKLRNPEFSAIMRLIDECLKEARDDPEQQLAVYGLIRLREVLRDAATMAEETVAKAGRGTRGPNRKPRQSEIPVAERRPTHRPVKHETVTAVLLYADGADDREVSKAIGTSRTNANNISRRFADEIEHLRTLATGDPRYNYAQQRFGWAGGSVMAKTIGERTGYAGSAE